MKERPILFSAPMVRAILEGKKTQTRRVVPHFQNDPGAANFLGWRPDGWAAFGHSIPDDPVPIEIRCLYGVPGDRLWVREAWRLPSFLDSLKPRDMQPRHVQVVRFEAMDDRDGRNLGRLRPGMHLPRIASRITLEVTGVRVERLQDISAFDAEREGLDYEDTRCDGECGATPCALMIGAFRRLWDTINGKRAPWASNPWVWVIEFKRAEAAARAA